MLLVLQSMKVFILEDISPALAKGVITQLESVQDKEPIEVVIFSQGGDVMSGNAIIRALKNTESHITTNVIGLAASMAAVISQIGDVRLIAEDASFNVHNSAMQTDGRGTKEEHSQAAGMLEAMDSLMLSTMSNDIISQDELATLMEEDVLLTAADAVALGFFDRIGQPVKAVAILNKSIKDMSKLDTIMSKISLQAVRLGLISAVLTDEEAARLAELEALETLTEDEAAELALLRAKAEEPPAEEEAPPAESGAEILTSEMIPREEAEKRFSGIEQMLGNIQEALEIMPSEEAMQDMVETETTAKLDGVLRAVKSKTTIPSAKQNFAQPRPEKGFDMAVINARVKEIKLKNSQN